MSHSSLPDAPEDDARVVAVAGNHALEQVAVLAVGAHEAVFVDDIHAERVADVEHGGRGGIVRTADGVAAEGLEGLDAINPQRVGHADTHACVVEMEIGAFEFHNLAVDRHAARGVEGHAAQAQPRHGAVGEAAVLIETEAGLI